MCSIHDKIPSKYDSGATKNTKIKVKNVFSDAVPFSAVGLPSYFGSMLQTRAEQVATAKSPTEHLRFEKLSIFDMDSRQTAKLCSVW